MKTTLATWALLATAICSTAAALWLLWKPVSPRDAEVADAFVDALDGDGDGVISKAEYTAVSDRKLPFSMVDIDSDGVLRAWELEVLLVSLSPLRKARLVQVL